MDVPTTFGIIIESFGSSFLHLRKKLIYPEFLTMYQRYAGYLGCGGEDGVPLSLALTVENEIWI
jgi:hypothetical protein